MQIVSKSIPNQLNYEAVEDFRSQFQSFLVEYIDLVKSNSQYIKEMNFMEKLLGYPPEPIDSIEKQGYPLFCKDTEQSFQKIFFCGKLILNTSLLIIYKGNEYYLLITSICIYEIWELIFTMSTQSNATILAILLTQTCIYVLESIRAFYGSRNISQKTLLDDKFLIWSILIIPIYIIYTSFCKFASQYILLV